MADHTKRYVDITKKLKPDGDAKRVLEIAKELDASRAKGKKDPIGHVPKHLKLLKTLEKEVNQILKKNSKDKDIKKVGSEMSKLMSERITRFSKKPKVKKG